jgi:hypothetical protein
MNGAFHGYGIYRWADGRVYYGEWKEDKHDGYGYTKYPDGKEYFGPWKNHTTWGDAVQYENG